MFKDIWVKELDDGWFRVFDKDERLVDARDIRSVSFFIKNHIDRGYNATKITHD